MLKLIYSDGGLHLEQVMVSVETVLAERVILAARLGHSIYVEPGSAAFLLCARYRGLSELDAALRQDANAIAGVTAVDADFVEVSINGQWIADSAQAHEGTFLARLSDRLEFLLLKAWEQSQSTVSSLS